MSRNIIDSFATKTTRNDRFAQMSKQEQIIEQKKREIQARLQQKEKIKEQITNNSTSKITENKTSPEKKINIKTNWKGNVGNKPNQNANNKSDISTFNMFSNDGTFLDQFKQQMNDKKTTSTSSSMSTSTSTQKDKSQQEKNYNDDRPKQSRWSKPRTISNNYDETPKKISRFSEPPNQSNPEPNLTKPIERERIPNFTPQTLATPLGPQLNPPQLHNHNNNPLGPQNQNQNPYQNEMFNPNFPQIPSQSTQITIQTSLPQQIPAFNPNVSSSNVILPMTINVPPPQLNNNSILGPPPNLINVPPPLISLPNQISVPPPCIQTQTHTQTQTVELMQIPAPNPIPVHTIPQPEPINTLTIPPPAPLQLQNIPSPSPIRLNEIPNPKPIDLMNIPAPGEDPKGITDPDFIKNVPPPNKSVPPPNLGVPELPNITIPPPNPVLPTSVQNVQILPPPIQNPPMGIPTSIPPPLPLPSTPSLIGLIQTNPTNQVSTTSIPSLMAQPILPPLSVPNQLPLSNVIPNVQINLPPPVSLGSIGLVGSIPSISTIGQMNLGNIPGPPPVLNQPPPLTQGVTVTQTSVIPPMNFPPPIQISTSGGVLAQMDINQSTVCPAGSGSGGGDRDVAMVQLARMVAQCGPGIEDILQQRSNQDPSLWFLFNKQSAAYQQYRQLVEQFRSEQAATNCNVTVKQEEYKPEDIYEPENATDDENDHKTIKTEVSESSENERERDRERKRKRRSRWGEKVEDPSLVQPITTVPLLPVMQNVQKSGPMLTKVTRNDPGLLQYAINTFGNANLSDDDWKKCEDHYKINLLYQDMVRKRQEIENLKRMGKNKYEYDSDEETDGGTWEHKLRMQEMEATQLWANELTRQAEGKHHIGDFLPPDELKKFMEKYNASKQGRTPNLSDYKEFKLKEDNIGFKMLQKLGWQEGQGLGTEGKGIVEPINKGSLRDQNQGLGLETQENFDNNDDEYTAYRKRMMLAYRFRPNPLNNPRRPYY